MFPKVDIQLSYQGGTYWGQANKVHVVDERVSERTAFSDVF